MSIIDKHFIEKLDPLLLAMLDRDLMFKQKLLLKHGHRYSQERKEELQAKIREANAKTNKKRP